MLNTIEIGLKVERLARPILKSKFDKVEWASKRNWGSPYDFKCYNNKGVHYIDVKTCLSKYVSIPKSKYNKLKKGWLKPFYFMLFVKKEFEIISFEELVKGKKYKIICRKDRRKGKLPVELHCKRCNHIWISKTINLVTSCPNCLTKVRLEEAKKKR